MWNPALKIRALGTHARCTQCCEDCKRLEKCSSPQERAEIMAARSRHLSSMLSARDLEMRENKMSEASCEGGCSFLGHILKIDMDGMDQAKFRAPRNISNAKAMKDLWRPTTHTHCWNYCVGLARGLCAHGARYRQRLKHANNNVVLGT